MKNFPRCFGLLALGLLLSACGGDDEKEAVSKAGTLETIDEGAKAASTTLVAGQPAQGELTTADPTMEDNSHYDIWMYKGRAGEEITITMESDAFDAYLLLSEDGDDGDVLAEDDDSAGELNPQIVHTLPADGNYLVVANSYSEEDLGRYTIVVESGSTDMTANPDNRDWATLYPGGGDPAGRYALLVGISDYEGTSNDLEGPVEDATLIGRILTERYGFPAGNVVLIRDEDATREHIIEAFQRHLGQAGANGVAVFYYSGHGTQMDSNLGMTGPLDPEDDGFDEALFVRGPDDDTSVILDDELGFLANGLSTDRVLFILDSCYAGTGTRGAAEGGSPKEVSFEAVKSTFALPATYLTSGTTSTAAGESRAGAGDVLAEPQRHLLLAASSADQVSWTASGWPKYGGTISVFTYYLASALESASPTATFSQVLRQVAGQTSTYTQSKFNARQDPQAEGTKAAVAVRDFLAK